MEMTMETPTFDFTFGMGSDIQGKSVSGQTILDYLWQDENHEHVGGYGGDVCLCQTCQILQPALIQVDGYIAALRAQLEEARRVVRLALGEMLDTVAPRPSFTDTVDELDAWLAGQEGEVG